MSLLFHPPPFQSLFIIRAITSSLWFAAPLSSFSNLCLFTNYTVNTHSPASSLQHAQTLRSVSSCVISVFPLGKARTGRYVQIQGPPSKVMDDLLQPSQRIVPCLCLALQRTFIQSTAPSLHTRFCRGFQRPPVSFKYLYILQYFYMPQWPHELIRCACIFLDRLSSSRPSCSLHDGFLPGIEVCAQRHRRLVLSFLASRKCSTELTRFRLAELLIHALHH